MIKNEREYRITKAQAVKFEQAIAELDASGGGSGSLHPLLQKAQRDSLQSQLDDLREQLAAYDALKSGRQKVISLDSLEELPRALIQARIAAGLSQRELAVRLGVKEQQVQRYEATEYAGASLARVTAVVRALGLHVREDVFLPGERSLDEVLALLKDAVARTLRSYHGSS
ncbi:MAG TPA: helix-turn-helix transcriptional regulator [Thermoanaerobaculia bacterium]